MTVTVQLPPELELRLHERAAASGLDVPDFLKFLIEKEVGSKPTLDEILAPFRREVAQSGMTDEQVASLFEDALREVRAERKAR